MKTISIIAAGAVAVIGALMLLFHLRHSALAEQQGKSTGESMATAEPAVAVASMSPNLPAPPPPPAEIPVSLASAGPPELVVPAAYTPLQYDASQSFEANLRQLRGHCDAWPEITEQAEVLGTFVAELLSNAGGQFGVVETAMAEKGGTSGYRCILLACLVSCGGPAQAVADLVWNAALNETLPGARRTAAFLASRVPDSATRTDQLWALLTDADDQVVVPALAAASRHMDQRVYEYISTELAEADDIHVRVAAIEAIGAAPSEHEGQKKLKALVEVTETSGRNPLSEASVAKRAAIRHLDMDDPDACDLLHRMATDPEEDPGVRAKAIGRFSLKDHPAAEPWLTSLLGRDIDNPLVARAVVDAMMTQPSAARIAFIRKQLMRMADVQMRDSILSRIGVSAGMGS